MKIRGHLSNVRLNDVPFSNKLFNIPTKGKHGAACPNHDDFNSRVCFAADRRVGKFTRESEVDGIMVFRIDQRDVADPIGDT